jgi:amidase
LIGRTLNPHNQSLSCGGSSGGEGALQALRGSTLGVGTDIGKRPWFRSTVQITLISNRGISSYSSGILWHIFTQTHTRTNIVSRRCKYSTLNDDRKHSVLANAAQNPGQNTYRSAVGFMSTSVDGLGLVLKAVLSTRPWIQDPAVVPIPYRQEIVSEVLSRSNPDGTATDKPLKFGVLWTNGIVEPHPPIRRGLKMVAESLKKAGHKVRTLDLIKVVCRGHSEYADCTGTAGHRLGPAVPCYSQTSTCTS